MRANGAVDESINQRIGGDIPHHVSIINHSWITATIDTLSRTAGRPRDGETRPDHNGHGKARTLQGRRWPGARQRPDTVNATIRRFIADPA